MSLKSPEVTVADALVADSSVNELLGGRIAPVIQDANTPLPFINWIRRGVARETTLGSRTGLATVTLDLDIYAATYLGARELADRCRAKLDGWNNAMASSVSIRHVALQNESDGLVQLSGGDLPPVYAVTQTYTILWQEI